MIGMLNRGTGGQFVITVYNSPAKRSRARGALNLADKRSTPTHAEQYAGAGARMVGMLVTRGDVARGRFHPRVVPSLLVEKL